MKLKIKKEILLDNLQLLLKVCQSKTIIPLLKTALFETENNKLILSVTDLETSVKSQIETEVLKNGSVCIPLKELTNIVKKFEKNTTILIETKNYQTTISDNNLSFELKGFATDDYPLFPIYPMKSTFSISLSFLKEMINKVIFAISDDTDFIYNNILFEIQNYNCKIVATDTYRLSLFRTRLYTDNCKIVIPSKALKIIQAIPQSKNESVEVFLSDSVIAFHKNNITIVSRLKRNVFPDIEAIISLEHKKKLIIDSQKLLVSCKKVLKKEIESKKESFLLFKIDKNILTLSSNVSKIQEKIKIKCENILKMKIVFQADYITDILKNIIGEITISFQGEKDAVVIKPTVKEYGWEYINIVMPIEYDYLTWKKDR